MDNIILIGFMGSGKTSVGLRLAKVMGYHFFDTDQMIEEKYQKSVSQIFEDEGEAYFRLLETDMLEQLLDKKEKFVLSVGGGLPIWLENREKLSKIGKIIYLYAQKDTLAARLHRDKTRPLLKGGNLEEKIESLMKERKEIYEQLADKIIKTDEKSLEEIITKIKEVEKDENSGNEWA